MQEPAFPGLPGEREPLPPQTLLDLSDTRHKRETFRIEDFLGAGGTSLVYRATRLSAAEGNVQGSLKEFFPLRAGGSSFTFETMLRSLAVTRDADGSLRLEPELCARQTQRLRNVFHTLHDLKKSGDLNYFIPYMQLYRGKHGVPYVFTPENLSGVTLERYLHRAHRERDRQSLLQILNTVYALACADEVLCRKGALLLDIKPRNVLLVRRSDLCQAPGQEFLADAVSLFDIESLVLQQELDKEPDLPVSPGFTAPELGGDVMLPRYHKVGPASDVYALGATLFYALTGQVAPATADCGRAVAQGPFAAEMQDGELRGALTRLLQKSLLFEPSDRMATPGEFGAGVMQAINRLGLRSTAETAEFARRQREKLPEMLTHLLFRWPFHEYARQQDIRVLLVGTDPHALHRGLDAVFAGCHVLGYQLHIAVAAPDALSITRQWCGGISQADHWLDCRGCAPFAPYDWQGPLAQLCCENTAVDCANMPRTVARWDPDVVLLLTENQAEGEALARCVPAPAGGRRLIAYRGGPGKTLYPERQQGGLSVVRMTPAACEDSFRETAERIGFNAHFLYERERDSRRSLQSIRDSYRNNLYNYVSSQATALAVKCKLWSAGVRWTNDPEHDAAAFAARLRQQPELVGRIAWLEHRRWVAAQLVRGVRPLPEQDYELLLAGNANGTSISQPCEDGRTRLFHSYLVPSRIDARRPEGWQTPRQWAEHPLSEPISPELDPLDHACAALTRMYVRTARQTDLHISKQALQEQLARNCRWLAARDPAAAKRMQALTRALLAAVARLEDLRHASPADIIPYESCYGRLQKLLAELPCPWKPGACNALETLHREVFSTLQVLRGTDAKRYDITLVENMGFVLCGKEAAPGTGPAL